MVHMDRQSINALHRRHRPGTNLGASDAYSAHMGGAESAIHRIYLLERYGEAFAFGTSVKYIHIEYICM